MLRPRLDVCYKRVVQTSGANLAEPTAKRHHSQHGGMTMSRKDRESRARQSSDRRTPATHSGLDGRGLASRFGGSASSARQTLPTSAGELLSLISHRDDGWLRWVRKRDTDTIYAKWKFTAGRRHNTYIMAIGQVWQVEYILQLLLLKLQKYDEGDNTDLVTDSFHNTVAEAGNDA